MTLPAGVVCLTTDFGLEDSYVGTMKGVILRIAPEARLVDLTHQITPQDVLEASLVLEGAYRFFPRGTVHLAVVDPGVGSVRRPIVVRSEDYYFVGPDNGLFTRIFRDESECEVFEIRDERYTLPAVSDTFHGRDIFAPVAAFLLQGVPADEFGPRVADPVSLSLPTARYGSTRVVGEVVYVDSFGNVITNIAREDLERHLGSRSFLISLNGRSIDRIHRTYLEQELGKTLALWGSSDLLEIAVAGGRADRRIGAGKGDTVLIEIGS